MNIGNAVRSQEFDAAHIDVASTWPAGVAALVSTAAKPQTASAIVIQTPEPRMANSSSISMRESVSSFIALAFFAEADSVFGSAERRPPTAHNNEKLIDQRHGQHQRAGRHRRLRDSERHLHHTVRDFIEE